MDALLKILAAPKKKGRTLGWVTREGNFLLQLKPGLPLGRCLSERHPSLQELDVVVLHDLVLAKALPPNPVKDKDIIYTRDMKEIKEKLKEEPDWTAFILTSPGVAAMAKVAESGNVMPPKTTYFYPKVPTGFTMMPLEQEIQ